VSAGALSVSAPLPNRNRVKLWTGKYAFFGKKKTGEKRKMNDVKSLGDTSKGQTDVKEWNV
jgi:hypothetical protein